jgi:electron transport complex protein RnfE
MGAGFTIALLLLGSIRELFGAGTLFGINIFGQSYTPIGILSSPPGAFIVLGCLIALMQYLKKRLSVDEQHAKKEEPKPNEQTMEDTP